MDVKKQLKYIADQLLRVKEHEEALRDLQEARRIARNNFKIREIITERILILQSYVQPVRRRS